MLYKPTHCDIMCVSAVFLFRKIELLETAIIFWVVFDGQKKKVSYKFLEGPLNILSVLLPAASCQSEHFLFLGSRDFIQDN